MRVVEWIPYSEIGEREEAVGGMGGWFGVDRAVDLKQGELTKQEREKRWNAGHRWKDYINIWKPEVVPYLEAIRESVLSGELKITGEQHQYSDHGVPVFEDGKVGSFSYRGWGDLMAAIWSEKEDENYTYMDFYM